MSLLEKNIFFNLPPNLSKAPQWLKRGKFSRGFLVPANETAEWTNDFQATVYSSNPCFSSFSFFLAALRHLRVESCVEIYTNHVKVLTFF